MDKQMNIEVKPLEWEETNGWGYSCINALGEFSIRTIGNTTTIKLDHCVIYCQRADVERAKQAAQDYVRDVVMQLIKVD